ncbi:MAG: hypothetical protein KGJ23_02635 [Euryarchaeota archaeon]|nr:hypothetical protein [Euryarchaeota archaeon]MDE1835494.1 hypothetical protein [Euryarchaeota archaeon]MDE1880387.1 hypothetical protein [Euryarchaeota archaeon]MDE2045775.1 hypothetical protein [Thermoplasmata archaeon]
MGLSFDAEGFVAIFGLLFGLFLLLSGIFTAYFGSGKSRKIGIGLVVGGLVVGILIALTYHSVWHSSLTTLVWNTFVVLLASVLGALAAIGLFLVAIMKS